MDVKNWPVWEDGSPVCVGEVAMSSYGPMRIDGIEIMDGGWRLWSNQSSGMAGCEKWLYIIDEGDAMGHPAREDEECDFWQQGDPTMPDWVFAPLNLTMDAH